MEVKINREIRNYTESMFFGLSMRQFIFSVLALGVAVFLYFLLKPVIGVEAVSWVCILGAAPFAAMGFFTYHQMTAEQFALNWIRTVIIEPKYYKFESESLFYRLWKNDKKRKRSSEKSAGSDTNKLYLDGRNFPKRYGIFKNV